MVCYNIIVSEELTSSTTSLKGVAQMHKSVIYLTLSGLTIGVACFGDPGVLLKCLLLGVSGTNIARSVICFIDYTIDRIKG